VPPNPAPAVGAIPDRGLTPSELARLFLIGPDHVRDLIKRGELGAVNVARSRCGRPSYVVLPHHVAA